MTQGSDIRAEVVLGTTDLRSDLGFFGGTMGLRLDMIYPADDPAVAVYSGHGVRVRLDASVLGAGQLNILTDDTGFADGARNLVSPGGTRVSIQPLNPPLEFKGTGFP